MSIPWTKFLQAFLDTLTMVGISAGIAVVIGLPIALALVVTSSRGLYAAPLLHRALSTTVDALRATPFVVMLVVLIPLTRLLVGSAIGVSAAIVPLTISITPYFARIAELSLREVDHGLVEAGHAMGLERWQIVLRILLPEALPGLTAAITITLVALFNLSAMAGVLGAGGLGDLAIRYGFDRYEPVVMVAVVLILFVLVTGTQLGGDWLTRGLRKLR